MRLLVHTQKHIVQHLARIVGNGFAVEEKRSALTKRREHLPRGLLGIRSAGYRLGDIRLRRRVAFSKRPHVEAVADIARIGPDQPFDFVKVFHIARSQKLP